MGLRLPSHAVGIAQARGEDARGPARKVDFKNGGAALFPLQAVFAHIAVGADGGVQLRSVRAGDDIFGPMVIERPARKVRHLDAGGGDFFHALAVVKPQNGVGIGDIERVADQRHSKRRVQVLHEYVLGRAARSVIAKERDAIGTGDTGARALLGGFVDPALDPLSVLRPFRGIGFRDENVAIGKHMEPAGMLETGRKRLDREPICGGRLGALRPAFRRRDLNCRDEVFDRRRQGRIGPETRRLGQPRLVAAERIDRGASRNENDENNDNRCANARAHGRNSSSP